MGNLLPIDLRSDTVTRPTEGMRRAIAAAEVGDDVFADDPTVNRLQEQVAEMMGKQAALFVPSGSMANQTAIRAQTSPGDEIIGDYGSHFYQYEAGAPAALSGCSVQLIHGQRGLFDADHVAAVIRPNNAHCPPTTLVVIENTHNRGGGTIWPVEQIARIKRVADEHGLKMHLDGARLMNACVATGLKPADYAKFFDSVSMCFSKGLGAPVGSIVAGSRDLIIRVHRFRKMFGGAMRQAGILAAAALYALDHHIDRLVDDHVNARRLAEGLADVSHLRIDLATVQTNIVYFEVDPAFSAAADFCARLKSEGVWMLPIGPNRVRAVTHLDVNREQIDKAIAIVQKVSALSA